MRIRKKPVRTHANPIELVADAGRDMYETTSWMAASRAGRPVTLFVAPVATRPAKANRTPIGPAAAPSRSHPRSLIAPVVWDGNRSEHCHELGEFGAAVNLTAPLLAHPATRQPRLQSMSDENRQPVNEFKFARGTRDDEARLPLQHSLSQYPNWRRAKNVRPEWSQRRLDSRLRERRR